MCNHVYSAFDLFNQPKKIFDRNLIAQFLYKMSTVLGTFPPDLFLFLISGGMKVTKRICSQAELTLQNPWLKPLLLPTVLPAPGSWYQV